jgi:hypothetical protein
MIRVTRRRALLSAAGVVLNGITLAAAAPEGDETVLYGPLRVRDMTPFNLLRLEMPPAHLAVDEPGTWGVEASITCSNTFLMSGNVEDYLAKRGLRQPLSQSDTSAILGLGEDAYFVDGEFGLLDLTFHYALTSRSSVYLTLSAYDFTGGFLDGAIEGFHDSTGLDSAGRDLVARESFQLVLALEGIRAAYLEPPVEGGLGDPVIGLRHAWPLGASRWGLVLEGAVKVAWDGERPFLSTGTNDYGVQASLQGRFARQAVYLSTGVVRTDGTAFGVDLERRLAGTVVAAYEAGITRHTNVIVQAYAGTSTVAGADIEELSAARFQVSLGLRSRRGRFVYGLAVTENVLNFENTPDLGVSLNLGWIATSS